MSEQNRPVDVAGDAALHDLLEDEAVVLLMFYTNGCGLCHSMEPVLGVVAKQTSATVATCNPRDGVGIIDEFDVRSVPTLALFVDGEEVERRVDDFVGADDLLDTIAAHAPDAVETGHDEQIA